MTDKKISVLIGSLRKKSFNRMAANSFIQLAPESLKLEIVEIGGIEYFNEDIELTPPKSWVDFREKIKSSDGVLVVSPEYNRSFTAVIKNALDVGSRPYVKNVFSGKPAAIATVSIGSIGGFGANQHLRQVMSSLNMYIMPQPEFYLGNAMSIFDKEDGHIKNDGAKNFLKLFIDSFGDWVNRF